MNYRKIINPFKNEKAEHLKGKWWHRLFVVLFFITLASVLIFTWLSLNNQEMSGFSNCVRLDYHLKTQNNPNVKDFSNIMNDVNKGCEKAWPVHSSFNLGIAILLTIILSYFLQFIYYKIFLYVIYGSRISRGLD